MTDTRSPDRTARPDQTRRIFVTVLAAVLLLQVAWWCVTPLFRGPDEVFHAYRVSSVAQGQWRPDYSVTEEGKAVATEVEADIVAGAETVCRELYFEVRPETCDPITTYDDGNLGMGSSADRYNPTYYALVAVPSLLLDGDISMWLTRALTALLTALVIAAAAVLLLGRARTPWPAAALVVITTPAVTFGTSVVAPNGMTFAAGLLLWAGLLQATRQETRTSLAAVAATAGACLLVTCHTTGPLWLATIVLCHFTFAGWRVYAAVLRDNLRAWLAAAGTVAAVTVLSLIWTVTASANDPSAGGEPLLEEVKEIPLFAHVLLWFFQTVGVLPNRFDLLWLAIYAVWLPIILAFLVTGWRKAGRRARLSSLMALGLSAAIPTVLTVMTYDDLGVAWQGRYGLPLLFGVVLLLAEGLDRREITLPTRVAVPGLVVLAIAHYLALLNLGLRERVGPYDDGRPWMLLVLVVVPLLVVLAYAGLARLAIDPTRQRQEIGSFS